MITDHKVMMVDELWLWVIGEGAPIALQWIIADLTFCQI
jgi:hypothetical protein